MGLSNGARHEFWLLKYSHFAAKSSALFLAYDCIGRCLFLYACKFNEYIMLYKHF